MLPTAGRGHGAFTRAQVPADQLRSMLGITSVAVRVGDKPLAITRSRADLRQPMKIRSQKSWHLAPSCSCLEPRTRLPLTPKKIANFTFDPPTIPVKAGATVTWVNADDIPHVVSEKNGAFRSNALDTNDTFTQTFPTAGTIEYFCAIHPHMTGKIIVTP
jgi:Copper binding proteins, plastocyanin/azurin family